MPENDVNKGNTELRRDINKGNTKLRTDINKGNIELRNDISKGNADNLSEDQKDTINIILKDYGQMEPYELREMTHKEEPWKNARGDLAEGASCNCIISKKCMGSYYGSL